MEETDLKENTEKALLISVDTGDFDAEASVLELEQLAESAGAQVVSTMVQKRPSPSVSSFVGEGRLKEICEFCDNNDVDLIIADSELTPVQVKNIEDSSGVRTIDRTTLILDIFAKRARSAEGKIQVELAQLKYSLPRLAGMGKSLSRLGGGIGTRGPGESKLETDRRHVRRRIEYLKESLDKIEKRRRAMHKRREKNRVSAVAIVGYTNAGKSTLMNRLTNAGVLEEDKLFATLDPTARRLALPDGRRVMLVDTVGLVRRLPHKLVEAFRSTLDEALWADVILNVCDASSDECAEHVKVTNELLSSLGCDGKPVINVLNKCDLVPELLDFPVIGKTVRISAATGFGIDELLNAIADSLPKTRRRAKILIPYTDGNILNGLRENGIVEKEEYTDEGIFVVAEADASYLDKIEKFICESPTGDY